MPLERMWDGSAWVDVLSAPANMVTTDTTQTISGAKTFTTTLTVPDSSFNISKINATGTRDATTYLRGDGTWATVGSATNSVTTDTAQTITGTKTFTPPAQTSVSLAIQPRSDQTSANNVATFANAAGSTRIRVTGAGDIWFVNSFFAGNNGRALIRSGDPGLASLTVQGATDAQTTDVLTVVNASNNSVLASVKPSGAIHDVSGRVYSPGNPPPASGGSDLSVDYTDTTPAAPATGLTIFTRHRARRLLAGIGPSGQDTSYQPALFANRLAYVNAINNVATQTVVGVAVTNLNGPTAVPVATTNFYTSMVRQRFATTTTAGVGAGTRSTTTQWFLSSTANLGGFFLVCRFGINQAVSAGRGFIGLAALVGTAPATAVYPAGSNPSTVVNQVGFGWDSTYTTMRFMPNGATASTANHVDLGANFPVNVAGASATNFYEARLFAPSGAGQNVRWSITRLNDGVFTQGQTTAGLPALNTLLGAHVFVGNGTTAAASSLDLQSLYIETDN